MQLIVKQDPGNPGVALNEVKDLVSQHVVAIIDSDSEDDAAWFAYIKKQPVAVFPPGSIAWRWRPAPTPSRPR